MASSSIVPVLLLQRSIRIIAMHYTFPYSQTSMARILPPLRVATPSPSRCAPRPSSSFELSGSNKLLFSSSRIGGVGVAAGAGRGGGEGDSPPSSSTSSSAASPRPPPEGTLITSPSNPFVKYCAKLRTSPSTRSAAGATLLAGSTIISEVCRGGGGSNGSRSGKERRSFAPQVLFLAPEAAAPEGVPRARLTLRAPAEVLARLAGLATTAPGSTSLTAVAVVDLPDEAEFSAAKEEEEEEEEGEEEEEEEREQAPRRPLRRLLALDGVQDPGNVGTLARTALALGWDGLYCLPGTADPWGDKAVRAARGAAWRLPVRAKGGSWGELVEVAREAGLYFLVADPREGEGGGGGGGGGAGSSSGSPPSASKRPQGICLVLGSEGRGLSADGRAALARCCCSSSSSSSKSSPSPSDSSPSLSPRVSSVSIPMSGEMESLNVATAGAVLMFALGEGAADFVRGLDRRG